MDCSMPGFPVVCSLSPRALSNSHPLSQWCHPIILLSVPHFSFCPQSFPASGSFPMSWPFTSHGQSIGASASVLPVNIQGWFPLGITCLISLLSKGLLRVFSSTVAQNHQFFSTQPSLWSNSNICTWLLQKKTIAFTILTFVDKLMSLFFNMLSQLFFLSFFFFNSFSSKEQVSYNFMAAVTVHMILEPRKIKSFTVSTFSSSICQSLQMAIAAMKLKDTCSLEGKLWPAWIAYSKAETLLCQQRSI